MPVRGHHDLREYHMFVTEVDIGVAGTILYFPIPISGRVVKCTMATSGLSIGSDNTSTFELGGVTIMMQAAAASLVMPVATSSAGVSDVLHFDRNNASGLALEAEDGDLVAAGSVLEIVSDGGGINGRLTNIMVTIRP